jgi:hypothetical protein
MKRGLLTAVWLAALALMWLLGANAAVADEGAEGSVPAIDDGIGDLPGSDLNGWFFNPEPEFPFLAPPDAFSAENGQPWTSAANLATIDYWLSLVEELGDDPSLLQQLYGLGMIDSPVLTPVQISQVIESNMQLISQENPGGVPEPVTWALLGGGLTFIGLYAVRRARRIRV